MAQTTKNLIKESLEKIESLGISTPRFFEYNLVMENSKVKNLFFSKFDIHEIL